MDLHLPSTIVEGKEKLTLSGRIVGSDGKPLWNATVASSPVRTLMDADGRFMLISDSK